MNLYNNVFGPYIIDKIHHLFDKPKKLIIVYNNDRMEYMLNSTFLLLGVSLSYAWIVVGNTLFGLCYTQFVPNYMSFN